MIGTICKVILFQTTGDQHHIFTSDDVLTSEEVLAYIRSEGFTGDVSVYENMQHVTKIPKKTLTKVVPHPQLEGRP